MEVPESSRKKDKATFKCFFLLLPSSVDSCNYITVDWSCKTQMCPFIDAHYKNVKF